jgi:agmatinase
MKEQFDNFDPNSPAESGSNIFGLPFDEDTAKLIVMPMPWEVTVSYRKGTAKAPLAVLEASYQVDLYDPAVHDAWKLGIYLQEFPADIYLTNKKLRKKAEKYIHWLTDGQQQKSLKKMEDIRSSINDACEKLHQRVKIESLELLKKNKIVAMLGGDHSTPLGLMQAMAEHYGQFGILQIDAHADLRTAYEGFEYSHASIMHNALRIDHVTHLVQVGIRDYCEQENEYIQSDSRIHTFFDRDIKHQKYSGDTWEKICSRIISKLPDLIYLSLDVDGLDPKLFPHTGTPVPGGLEFEELLYLLEQIIISNKKIIGFDINEIVPGKDEWDANVGARLLYRIANLCLKSNL